VEDPGTYTLEVYAEVAGEGTCSFAVSLTCDSDSSDDSSVSDSDSDSSDSDSSDDSSDSDSSDDSSDSDSVLSCSNNVLGPFTGTESNITGFTTDIAVKISEEGRYIFSLTSTNCSSVYFGFDGTGFDATVPIDITVEDPGTYTLEVFARANVGQTCSFAVSLTCDCKGTFPECPGTPAPVTASANVMPFASIVNALTASNDDSSDSSSESSSESGDDMSTTVIDDEVADGGAASFAKAVGSESSATNALFETDDADAEHVTVSLSKETLMNLWALCAVVVLVNVTLCVWCHCKKKAGKQRFAEDEYVSDVQNV